MNHVKFGGAFLATIQNKQACAGPAESRLIANTIIIYN